MFCNGKCMAFLGKASLTRVLIGQQNGLLSYQLLQDLVSSFS